MNIEFSAEELEKLEAIKAKYPETKAALMPLLWMAQNKWGWLSPEVLKYASELLGLPLAHVEGVANFYTMYFKKPMGKKHIQVCTNVSCMLRGGDKVLDKFSEKLLIGNNETTADGEFSIEEVECMGACGGAPMIAVNEDYFENFDINKIDEFLANQKSK
jgi:NADH-quinone oxidoreductase E subunit